MNLCTAVRLYHVITAVAAEGLLGFTVDLNDTQRQCVDPEQVERLCQMRVRPRHRVGRDLVDASVRRKHGADVVLHRGLGC